MSDSVSLSIIVPVYNSSKFLHLLLAEIEKERKNENWDLELVLVDDGSKDSSFDVIRNLSLNYNFIKAVRLSKNFGHQIAVKTGLGLVSKEYVAIIDDDLQDPPNLLPRFLKVLQEGYDVAYGVRKKRKEHFFKRLSYSTFYRLMSLLSNIDVQLDSGDFCVMKLHVVKNMLKLREQNPFLRGMRSWVGFKQIGVEYERHSRVDGDSGYTLKKLLKIAMDGIFSFSNVPIKLITLLGCFGLFFALFYSGNLIYRYVFFGIEVRGFTSLVLMISFFSSLILICLGIIGEYIVRIYDEVRQRPYSIIAESINVEL